MNENSKNIDNGQIEKLSQKIKNLTNAKKKSKNQFPPNNIKKLNLILKNKLTNNK